ncbi:tenascin-X-like [Gastrophryne carolinensis]
MQQKTPIQKVPEIINNVTTQNITTTSISLSWEKPDGNASSYFIQIQGDPSFNRTVTTTSDTIENLTPGNYYTFLVSAQVGGNVQGKSNSTFTYTLPEVVKNLTIENITTTSISLSWEKPDGNVSSYFIQILGDPTINRTVTTTSDTIENLTPGNYYTFLVSAQVGGSVQGKSNSIFTYTSPEVVKNLTIENITTTSISLSWEKPVGNVSSYFIQILGDPTFNRTVTTTSDIIENLTPGNYYTFLVSAQVGGNVQGKSNSTFTYTFPEIVKNLTIENITTTSISLSWEKPDGNASSYFIQILGDPSFNRTVTTTSDTIENLTPGNYYTFLVSAQVGGNVQGKSNSTFTYTSPEVVNNLTIENITTTSISLSWDKPDGNVSSYFIQIQGDPSFNRTVTTTSDTIENLTPGNYYTFLVSAQVGGNVQGKSNSTFTYTPPEVVKNLTIENITTTSIYLSWEKPDGNVSSYFIQILGDPSFNRTVTTTSDTIENLTPGNYYTFLVSAQVGGSVQGRPNSTFTYTPPEVVKNLIIENITTTSISLSWEKPDGNVSSYFIQILGDPSFNRTVTTTSDTIENLTPGNYYTFLVSAQVGGSVQGRPNSTFTYTPPEVVKNLIIENITTTSISLSWEKPDGNVSSYFIQILGDPSFNRTVTTTSDTIENLTPGNYYTFLVSAQVGGSVQGRPNSTFTYTPPEVVKNLIIENITTTSISLSWEKPDGNVSSYFIQILGDPSFNRTVTTTSDTIENLTPGNYYTFLVSAQVGGNVQGKSNSTFTYTLPEIVKNLTIENITTTSISLSWEKPDGNVSSYFIQILGDPSFNRTVTTTSDIIENLTPGNYYTFLVSAQVGGNVQGKSNSTFTYTSPEVVMNLTIENITTTSISLSWDKPDGNVSSYFIQILGDPSFNRTVTTTSDTIENLTPGNYYTFLVSAQVGGSVQGRPNSTFTYTSPEVVKNLTIENTTTTSISLSWDKPDGNVSSYFIQILGDPSFNRIVTTTSDTIESLTPGNYYTFLVSAQVGGNVQGKSNSTFTYTPPEVVKNLTIENITATSISLSWEKPDGNVSSYFIQILGDPSFNRTVTTTSDTIENLTPGNYYTFLVSAQVGDNVQGKSNSTFTYTPPEVVKNLTIENITTTSISLSWEKPDGNVSSYFIQILGDPSFNRTVTTTSDTIENLTPGNYYTFLVSAQVGGSVQGRPNSTFTYTPPEVVKNLTIENTTTTSISLSWEKPAGNVSSYFIQILGDPSFNRTVTTTSDTVENLTPGHFYTFLVSAQVGGNVQGKSNSTFTYTPPEVVKNLTTENITTTSISLSWEKPDGNVSSYFIQILGDPSFNRTVTTTSDTIENLTPGNYYTFRVSAQVGGNVQGKSNSTFTYTLPEIVKNLTIENITTTSISLSWDKPDGNVSSYFIQILGDPSFNRTVTTTSDTVENLTPGNFYTFLVSAQVGGNVQGKSNSTFTYTSPEVVMNLTIENITTPSISLSWDKPEGNVSSYFIQILGDPSFNRTVTTTSDTIENLTPGNYYTFLVSAQVGGNVQGKSNSTFTYTLPEIVKNLTIENITTTSISLSWDKPDGNVSSYFIQILGDPSFNRTVTTTSDTIENLTPGNYYSFLVSAQVGGNVQGKSNSTFTYTSPEVVKNLTIENITTTSISLSWEKPDGNVSSYFIQILGDPSFNRTVTTTSDTIENLTPGNYYTFLVSAQVGGSVQGRPNSTFTYTPPEVVKNLTIENTTTTSISLSWEKPAGNVSSYFIQILGDPSFNRTVTTTSDAIENLTPGNFYTFLVSAQVGGNVQGKSNSTFTYTPPEVVKNLTIENITTTSISLSWEKPDGNVSSYFIQIQGDPSFNRTVTTTSDTIENLTPGNYYTFLVSAQVGGNVQGKSNSTFTYTSPEVVMNLTIENITTTSISLSWDKPEGNVSSYFIQILGDPSFNRTVTTTSDTIENLTPGNYYTFLVSAQVGGNVQGKSNSTFTYTFPEIVKNLTIENITTTSISLSWDKPDGNVSSYFIQILGDPSFNRTVTTTSDTVENLTPGNFYTFLVSAQVGGNVQGKSNSTFTYTSPEVVMNLTIENITTTSISLSWDKPEGNVSSYFIQILGDPSFNRTVTTTSDTIENLTPGNYYTFLVSAQVGGNVQGKSNSTFTYTSPEVVKNLTIENITTTSISLSWEKPDGNVSSYFIQILGDPSFNRTVTKTSDTIENLTPGNYYTFLVSAQVGGSVQGRPNSTFTYTPPEVVKNLTIENTTTTSISLSWEKPAGNVSSYFIQILGDPSFNRTVTTTSDAIENLTPGNFYTFLVSAQVGGNVQGKSNSTFTYTPPEVVKNLTIENITTTSISLSWEKPDGNVSSYFIQILGDPSFNRTVTTTSDTIENLTPGNYYTFLVSAQVGANVQGKSNSTFTYTSPEVVKNLTIENITTTSISLSWEKPDGNVSSYFIQILGDPSFNRTVTTTSDTIENLTPGNYYTFLISAQVGGSVQGKSNSIFTYTPPEVVKNLTIENTTTTSISLSWEKPDGNVSSYFFQILGDPSFNRSVTTTSDTIENLTPGNVYTFLVSAQVGGNVRGKSNSTFTYTRPGIAGNFVVDYTSADYANLSWIPPYGNYSHYLIEVTGNDTRYETTALQSVSIRALTSGQLYTFKIWVVTGSGLLGEPNITVTSTFPGTVSNIRAETTTTTSVRLIWDAPAGNKDYYVIRMQDNATFYMTTFFETVTINGLVPGAAYTFLISAKLSDAEGAVQDIPLFIISAANCYHFIKEYNLDNGEPATVTFLKASKINNSSMYVSWQLPEGNRSYYQVDVSGELAHFFYTVTTESISITNLTSGEQYTVKVTAFTGGDLQGDSNEITILVSDIITAIHISTTSVQLNWDPYIGANSSYIISVYGEPYSNVTVNTTEVQINNLTAGNFYRIQISAFRNNIFLYGYGGEITLYTRK